MTLSDNQTKHTQMSSKDMPLEIAMLVSG